MSDLFFALSRQGRGMADKNRRIPVNRAALPMDGKNLPRARLWVNAAGAGGVALGMRAKGPKSPNPPRLQEML
jgi:hypothetical protein